jgi:hypothetical protein
MLKLESSFKLAQVTNHGANSIILENSSIFNSFGIVIFIVGVIVIAMLIQNSGVSDVIEHSALHVPKMLKQNAEILGKLNDSQTQILLDHNSLVTQNILEGLHEISSQIANLENINNFSNNLDFEAIPAAESFYSAVNSAALLLGAA